MTNYAVQEQNQDLVSLLAAHFRLLYNPTHAFADAISMLKMFPGIVGIWPGMGISGSTRNLVSDVSGNGLNLTPDGAQIDYDASVAGFVPHMRFNATPAYFFRAEEGILDISGTETLLISSLNGLTFGGWFYFSSATNQQSLMSKYNPGANDRSYFLFKNSTHNPAVLFSSDGIASSGIAHSSTVAAITWYFIAGVFDPSASISIWLNDDKESNITSIPASIFNSAQQLRIGRLNDGTSQMTGRASLCFLSAAAVPDIFINTFYQMTAPLFGISV